MERDPRELAYVLATVEVLVQLGDAPAALDLLTNRGDAFAWSADYQTALAETHEQLGEWGAAARAWRQVVAARETQTRRTAEAANGGGKGDGASARCTPAELSAVRERLALALSRDRQYEEAIPIWRQITGAADDAASDVRAARADHAGNLAQGRHGAYEQAVDEGAASAAASDGANPGRLRARLGLAECYLETGRTDAARTEAQAILRDSPEQPRALLLLACALGSDGALDAALRLAQRALAAAPRDVRALETVAALAFRMGDQALATTSARRLVTLDPGNSVAQRLLASPR